MKIEVDVDIEEVVAKSLLDSMEIVEHYIQWHSNSLGGDSDEYHKRCYNESVRDYNALVIAHNYYTPADEHITTRYEEMD